MAGEMKMHYIYCLCRATVHRAWKDCTQVLHTSLYCLDGLHTSPDYSVLCAHRGVWTTPEGHPANPHQKPLLQLEFLLRACHQGGRVVDLCCGTGSGMIAALRMGFDATGIDKDQNQVDVASARVKEFAEREVSRYSVCRPAQLY